MKTVPFILFIFAVMLGGTRPVRGISVGITPFTGVNSKKTSSALTAALSHGLAAYPYIQLVERAQMKRIIREIKHGLSDMTDVKTAAQAGKLRGVQVLVFGAFRGRQVYTRAVHVETGRVLVTAAQSAPFHSSRLTQQLAAGIETYVMQNRLKQLRNDSPAIDLLFRVRVKNAPQNRSLTITPEKTGRLHIGDTVVFQFRSNRTGYLSLVDIRPDGEVVLLFPNSLTSDNRVQAGRVYSIPPPDANFSITATQPAGRDTVVAFFTRKKTRWLDPRLLTGRVFRRVKKDNRRRLVRGFSVTATQLTPRDWESRVIEIDVTE